MKPGRRKQGAYNSLMRSRLAAVLALSALMLVPMATEQAAPQRQSAAPARADAAVPFKAGETLTYGG